AAAKARVALEINANPHRLDLRDQLVHAALAAGCRIAINTERTTCPASTCFATACSPGVAAGSSPNGA
ncbi:MAG: hypothetical protein ACKPEA_17385, partial [Planctomycetota bacterium]